MGMRETAPFGVRMPEELKGALAREAKIHGRSLNSEIVHRLRASLGEGESGGGSYTLREDRKTGYDDSITDAERRLLVVFRSLEPEKQLALLALLG